MFIISLTGHSNVNFNMLTSEETRNWVRKCKIEPHVRKVCSLKKRLFLIRHHEIEKLRNYLKRLNVFLTIIQLFVRGRTEVIWILVYKWITKFVWSYLCLKHEVNLYFCAYWRDLSCQYLLVIKTAIKKLLFSVIKLSMRINNYYLDNCFKNME